ncbi:MAG: HEAT repeat domain-containing protein [Terriglobia bacterium]
MKRSRPLSGAAVRVSLAFFLLYRVTVAGDAAHWITSEEQDQIVQRLRAVLPAGSIITATSLNRTPEDWYTMDSRGFEIDGQHGQHEFRIWFLPRDWIGIRRFAADRTRLVYWEGVLLGSNYKTVTNTDSVPIYEAIERLGMSTPSLVNSGWGTAQEIYKDRLPEVAEQAKLLITRFCKDDPCKGEAAYSLIVLGTPAKSVTMDCAEHATGRAQEFCVSALGYWKGKDSVQVLERVISSPASSSRVQNYAAISLDWIADPSVGPTLLRALHTVQHPEAAANVSAALERIHYAPAAPEILAQLEKESDPFYQTYYAKALATLRYQPAVPAIRKLCKTTEVTPEWIWNKQQKTYLGWSPEIALLRLTASWGQPSNGIRLLLLPPGNVQSSAPIQLTALIENTGDRPLDILATSGDVIVDGKAYSRRDSLIMDGNITLSVNDVALRSIGLTGLIIDGGVHKVEYRLENAVSNQLTLNGRSDYPKGD